MTQLSIEEGISGVTAHKIRCLHSNCWGAKCIRCKKWLTKHAFTQQDALEEGVFELQRQDGKRHQC